MRSRRDAQTLAKAPHQIQAKQNIPASGGMTQPGPNALNFSHTSSGGRPYSREKICLAPAPLYSLRSVRSLRLKQNGLTAKSAENTEIRSAPVSRKNLSSAPWMPRMRKASFSFAKHGFPNYNTLDPGL